MNIICYWWWCFPTFGYYCLESVSGLSEVTWPGGGLSATWSVITLSCPLWCKLSLLNGHFLTFSGKLGTDRGLVLQSTFESHCGSAVLLILPWKNHANVWQYTVGPALELEMSAVFTLREADEAALSSVIPLCPSLFLDSSGTFPSALS